MGLNLDDIRGQTPLEEDEKNGLLIPTITTRGELDEFEQLNIEKAIAWSMSRRFNVAEILSEGFVGELHRRMFDDVWEWAGTFRTTNENMGVDKRQIRIELKNVLDDSRYWIDHDSFPADEIAVRFSHRIVSIHCFPNGNGRHSRLIADILVSQGLGMQVFSWGSIKLVEKGAARSMYLKALNQADEGDFRLLIEFARE